MFPAESNRTKSLELSFRSRGCPRLRLLFFLLCFLVAECDYCIQAFPPPSSTSIFHSGADGMTKPSKPTSRSKNSPYRNDSSPTSTKLGLSIIPLTDLSSPFWRAIGIYTIVDALGFVISLATGSHVHLDLMGTGAFALASLPNLLAVSSATLSQQVSSMAVCLWGTKLASFLFYRALQVGHDHRLTETLSTASGTFGFWFITFLWNLLCSMPYLLGLLSNKCNKACVQAGGLVFLVGLVIETLADAQKWFFKQSHPGQFCNVGLWTMSQHPNMFGNLVLWGGILIMNLPALIMPVTSSPSSSIVSKIIKKVWSYRRLALALLSPLFMWALFWGQANGFITNATQLAESKYGNDPAFHKYIQQVPKIIPKLW